MIVINKDIRCVFPEKRILFVQALSNQSIVVKCSHDTRSDESSTKKQEDNPYSAHRSVFLGLGDEGNYDEGSIL